MACSSAIHPSNTFSPHPHNNNKNIFLGMALALGLSDAPGVRHMTLDAELIEGESVANSSRPALDRI